MATKVSKFKVGDIVLVTGALSIPAANLTAVGIIKHIPNNYVLRVKLLRMIKGIYVVTDGYEWAVSKHNLKLIDEQQAVFYKLKYVLDL